MCIVEADGEFVGVLSQVEINGDDDHRVELRMGYAKRRPGVILLDLLARVVNLRRQHLGKLFVEVGCQPTIDLFLSEDGLPIAVLACFVAKFQGMPF